MNKKQEKEIVTIKSNTIQQLVEKTQKCIEEKKLYEFSKTAAKNQEHPLQKSFNTYPSLPFTISKSDLNEISKWANFPYSEKHLENHQWTPTEKLFYSHLWKDGKLPSTGRIIEGIERAYEKGDSEVSKAIVYHFFGRHLVDLVANPIIDQHSYRAYRLINKTEEEEFDALCAIKQVPSAEEAKKYCEWFQNIITSESCQSYEKTRIIDSYLFALGKYSKSRN